MMISQGYTTFSNFSPVGYRRCANGYPGTDDLYFIFIDRNQIETVAQTNPQTQKQPSGFQVEHQILKLNIFQSQWS